MSPRESDPRANARPETGANQPDSRSVSKTISYAHGRDRGALSNPAIHTMNGDALSRPLDPPKDVRRGMVIGVIAALVIGALFLMWYFDGIVNEPKREQAALEQNVEKSVDLALPDLAALMPLDDVAISELLVSSGLNLYEKSPAGSGQAYEVIKLPDDVTVADAAALYMQGVNKISAATAVKLLNGSWDLKVDRENGTNMGLHYADFKSGGVEEAVQNAIAAAGLTDTPMTDSGVDNSGNTYTAGTIETATGVYTWRVSALPLSEIYKNKGIPEDAVYVGIRMMS